MPRFTAAEYQAFLARREAASGRSVASDVRNGSAATQCISGGTANEAELHQQIIDECKRRGWIAFHGSMAHRTFRTAGEFDFVILADNGKVHLIEAKTAKGKLSTEQLGIHAWAKKLLHNVFVVRSIDEFNQACSAEI